MQRTSLQRVGVWVVAVSFGALTMASTATLLVWNVLPGLFPTGAHALLGSAPLALTAIGLLIYQIAKRPRPLEVLQAILVAAAFLCWAANQLLPDIPQSLLLNDMAIALFVLDVFLLIVSKPPALVGEDVASARFARHVMTPDASVNGERERHVSDAPVDEARSNTFP